MDSRNGSPGVCPRCEGDTYLTLFQAPDRLGIAGTKLFHVVECSRCALIRLDPIPSEQELASYYPPDYWWESDGPPSGRLVELYRRFVSMDHLHFVTHGVERSAPMLDVGCGSGWLVRALRRKGFRAYGLDESAIMAHPATERYGLPVAQGLLANAPFAAGTFSAITLFHVLEHVRDPMTILEELRRLLQPSGKLFVQIPNAACWQFLLLGKRWSGLDVPRHPIHFRSADLEDLLDATGFEVRRRKFFSLRDNPTGLASSIWPALDPLARRVRRVRESTGVRLVKDLMYFALTLAATPFTLLEAAGAAGSTVMVEAVRRGES